MEADRWFGDAEKLLGDVAQLVEQRQDIAGQLAQLAELNDVAMARIDQLEHLNAALRIELYELKGAGPNKRSVGRLARLIGHAALALSSAFALGVADTVGKEVGGAAMHIHEQATKVVVHCELPPDDKPPSPPVNIAPRRVSTAVLTRRGSDLVVTNPTGDELRRVHATLVSGPESRIELAPIQGASVPAYSELIIGRDLDPASEERVIVRLEWTDIYGENHSDDTMLPVNFSRNIVESAAVRNSIRGRPTSEGDQG